MTLRGRLLAGIVVLVALGLAGTDVALYVTLDSFLTSRADRRLDTTADRVEQALGQPRAVQLIEGFLRTGSRDGPRVVLLDGDGRPLLTLPGSADPVAGVDVARSGKPVDVDVAGRPSRVVRRSVNGGGRVRGVLIVASRRADTETLHRLVVGEALVSAVAVIALTALALGVLRIGLRPVSSMAAAAGAIAAGERHRRVPVATPRDELGQLAVALNQAFDQRRDAEERLRRFVAEASHELRTPLTTIQGWTDLYFQGGLPDKEGTETAMTRIAEVTGRLSRLVEELLLLARLDEQRPLDREPVDLAELVAEVVADARVVAPDHPIATAVHAVGVAGDADRLRQVVRNLVGNAVEHTPPGTPTRVTLAESDEEVRLTVADDGPGIPAGDWERVFERFQRAGGAHGGTGLGLGLAIVRSIVTAHGGAVRIVGRSGSGTEVRVTLPRKT